MRAHEEDSLAPDPVMIFRLSQKLNAKIEAGILTAHPLNENAFADWSAHLFVAGRTQYLLLSNTKSLYSPAGGHSRRGGRRSAPRSGRTAPVPGTGP